MDEIDSAFLLEIEGELRRDRETIARLEKANREDAKEIERRRIAIHDRECAIAAVKKCVDAVERTIAAFSPTLGETALGRSYRDIHTSRKILEESFQRIDAVLATDRGLKLVNEAGGY